MLSNGTLNTFQSNATQFRLSEESAQGLYRIVHKMCHAPSRIQLAFNIVLRLMSITFEAACALFNSRKENIHNRTRPD